MPEDREVASRALHAGLDAEWPGPALLGILRRHADTPEENASFGIWVMIERVGFHRTGEVNGELRWRHVAPPGG